MHPRSIILLAYSRLGGLEGEALQRAIFLLLLLPAKLAKAATKELFSGACGPRSPRWRVSQQYQSIRKQLLLDQYDQVGVSVLKNMLQVGWKVVGKCRRHGGVPQVCYQLPGRSLTISACHCYTSMYVFA